MKTVLKNALLELYKSPLKIFCIFLLNLLIVFGINKTGIIPEIFILFLPAIFGILFTDKNNYKINSRNKVLINVLLYILIFSINNWILYNYVGVLENKSLEIKGFLTDKDMFFFKLVTIVLDSINYIFALGIFYSLIKEMKCKIAVIDMFKYFSEKSSKIIVVFYSLIFSMFSTILILYGVTYFLCYNFINILFLLTAVIFISFVLLIFKNFLLSEETDTVMIQLKNKKLKLYKKDILKILGLIIISAGITIFFFISFVKSQNTIVLVISGISLLILITVSEIAFLNILMVFSDRKIDKIITFKKVFNMIDVNLIGISAIGLILWILYFIDMNFFVYNIFFIYVIPAVVLNYLGFIINFQLIGIFIEKPFSIAFKEGIYLGSKFMNLKILVILLGGNTVLIINFLNGIFPILVWIWNILISFYLTDFYLKEIKKY